MRHLWLILSFGVFLISGCGTRSIPKAKVEAERKHFNSVVRPKLEAELARNYPNLPSPKWTQEFTQQNRSHNEPLPAAPPKVTGVSFHIAGTAGKAKIHMIGSYSVKDGKDVSCSIQVDQDGEWTWGEFPAKPMRDFGWPEPAISALEEWGSGDKYRGSHGGVGYSVHTEHYETNSDPSVDQSKLRVLRVNSSIGFSVPR